MNDKNVTFMMTTLCSYQGFFLTENRICEFLTFAASICKKNSLYRTGYLEYDKLKPVEERQIIPLRDLNIHPGD